MEGAPEKSAFDQLKCFRQLKRIKGVEKVYDLHAWMINRANAMMTVHIKYETDPDDPQT
jgi:Co/Zn/Cd efflux system component